MVMLDVLRLLIAVIVAFFAGKLISRLRLPSILGWLITGMVLGPHALGLLNNNVLDSGWFEYFGMYRRFDDWNRAYLEQA